MKSRTREQVKKLIPDYFHKGDKRNIALLIDIAFSEGQRSEINRQTKEAQDASGK